MQKKPFLFFFIEFIYTFLIFYVSNRNRRLLLRFTEHMLSAILKYNNTDQVQGRKISMNIVFDVLKRFKQSICDYG